jgi:penicillin amidase
MTPLLLKNEQSWWFTAGNEKTEGVESRKKLLYEVLLETIKDLGATLGDNVDAWRWEKLHTVTFEHPLGKQKPLDFVFNLGPYPTGGSSTTINNGEYMLKKPYKQILGPSTRQIVDLADIEKSLAINTTGQSGQPNDVHYRDQVEMWLNGLYHEVFMDPARLESAGYNLLELIPAK